MATGSGQPRRPSCYDLLDRKVRQSLAFYSWIGVPTRPIAQAIAYIELLEEELARREGDPQSPVTSEPGTPAPTDRAD